MRNVNFFLKISICLLVLYALSIYPIMAYPIIAIDFKKVNTTEQIETINSTAVNNTIIFFKKGLLSQYSSTLWSITLVILSIAGVILGYYGGLLNSGCVKDPVAEFLAFVPMIISFLVLGTFGFVIIGWCTVIGMIAGILIS